MPGGESTGEKVRRTSALCKTGKKDRTASSLLGTAPPSESNSISNLEAGAPAPTMLTKLVYSTCVVPDSAHPQDNLRIYFWILCGPSGPSNSFTLMNPRVAAVARRPCCIVVVACGFKAHDLGVLECTLH